MVLSRLAAALAVVCLCLTAGGCGFKDIDKRFFVVAMGVDSTGKKDKPYLVTLRLAIPTSRVGEGLAESQIEQLEAPSIAEAVRNMKSHVDKELDFGQCRVFLFGDALVKESMTEPMSWLNRRRDIQLVSYVALARPDAQSVLSAKPTTERMAGNAFFLTFGKEGTVSPYTVTEFLFDSFRRFTERGLDPYLPIISFDGDSYVVEHLTLLNKKKESLVLSPEETQLYNLTANAFPRSGISINYKGKRLAYYVSRATRSVSISQGDIPTVKLDMHIRGVIEQTPLSLMNENMSELQKQLERRVNDDAEKLMVKIRDAGVDPYGFGLKYMAQYFGKEQDWEYWESVYPRVKFEVTSHVKIESTGLIR